MSKTCFSVMPFGDAFKDIDRIVEKAAEQCGLAYVRGDRTVEPGSVLPQILRDIRQAAVVVADITGDNPNVFYELGIAHHSLGPERVVLITQSTEASPYDVHEFRQLAYKHTEEGRMALGQLLPAFLLAAITMRDDRETWNVIRGRRQRTRLIVRDLERLLQRPGNLEGVTIRVISGLSSVAISDHEPSDPDEGPEYNAELRQERDRLRDVLLRGAKLKALLHPPRLAAKHLLHNRLDIRYQRLLGLLANKSDTNDQTEAEADVAAMQQCEFLLMPVSMPNLFLIDKSVAYEGLKRGGNRGFERTHCESDAAAVTELIEQFDSLFVECRGESRRAHPDGNVRAQIQRCFDEFKKSMSA